MCRHQSFLVISISSLSAATRACWLFLVLVCVPPPELVGYSYSLCAATRACWLFLVIVCVPQPELVGYWFHTSVYVTNIVAEEFNKRKMKDFYGFVDNKMQAVWIKENVLLESIIGGGNTNNLYRNIQGAYYHVPGFT